VIEARGLSKHYGEFAALKQATFTIGANEVVGLLGPNGAGKSTLMKLLTGFLHPTEGSAVIGGIDVLDQPEMVQRDIGYLPESAPLYPDMMVQEYLQMIADLRQLPVDDRARLIAEAAVRTGIEDFLVKPIGQLSKGYKQRVGLAQAILHKPKVLILDEPTSGLDPNQIVEIRKLIKTLAKTSTVLLSTHILSEVEANCERVIVIADGELRADAKLDDLRESNIVVTKIEGPAGKINMGLRSIDGVSDVLQFNTSQGYTHFHVMCEHADQVAPLVFDLVQESGWRLSELKADQRTLESVFHEVVGSGAGAIPARMSGKESEEAVTVRVLEVQS